MGPIKLHSYGLMIFFAFTTGTWLAMRRAKAVGIKSEIVVDLVIWILISSLLGARTLYVFTHLNEFRGRWLDTISPIQSDGSVGIAGLVVLGGVIAAVPTTWYYLKKKNIPFPKMLDVLTPAYALGMGIGRVGCLLNGCCFGEPTKLPWGIVFPSTCIAGSVYPNTAIHPTQIYAVLYNLLIALILILRTKSKKFDGELFYLFLIFYGVFRFLNESVRYYRESMILAHFGDFGFTISMGISLILALGGLLMLMRGYKNSQS